MGSSIPWIKHVELYVSSFATPSQQMASAFLSTANVGTSVDAVANLVKKDSLTLEALVREMEMYLTTTDSIIRSRGILLLAEILAQLTSKHLSRATIHSLIEFFAERLADWKALRGAIVGCLALLRRKNDVGNVTNSEAKVVAEFYLQNLQVQSLGQCDRKLSFQLMECLLDHYPGAVRDMEDNLVYGICEAVDGEKDPQCLLLVFHIVESLARLYPGVTCVLAKYAEDLFGILGCYFPIHFTHPKTQDDGRKEELSRALMLAFAATPLFEPFAIPLLLEKLSSSLPSAKVESFRYLSYCIEKYGAERIAKYADALWSSIKDATYISPHYTMSVESEEMGGMSFHDSDIMVQAFALLHQVIRQYTDFIGLIVKDNDINVFMNSLSQYAEFGEISVQVKQRLHAVGRILSTCAESSVALCNKVFESFFPLLMTGLGLSVLQPSENNNLNENCFSPIKFNYGALYLCVGLLEACRNLTMSFENCTLGSDFSHQTCYVMLGHFCELLTKAFVSILRANVADDAQSAYIYVGVKGLQILATFPGSFTTLSNFIYDNILVELVSIITSNGKKTLLWKLALKAVVEIGFFIDKYPDPEKAASFEGTFVEKIISLIFSDDSVMPLSLRLQAAFEMGSIRKEYMLRVVHGLDESIYTKFSASFNNEDHKTDAPTVELFDWYSKKVLPWSFEVGGFDEIPLNFVLNILTKIENVMSTDCSLLNITTGLLVATMNAIRKAVGSCSEKSQEKIINKAVGLLSQSSVFESTRSESDSCILKVEGLQHQPPNFVNSSVTNERIISLFSSVVIALRPHTSIPNGKMILHMFISSVLHGHIPSAHALGSLVNKLPLEISAGNFSLNEALEMVFHSLRISCYDNTSGSDDNGINFSSLRLKTSTLQSEMNSIIGLAWVGKGLLMRGHEKVKDITMTLISFLTVDREADVSEQLRNLIDFLDDEGVHQLMKCAGDAFHVIMSDSEECLNRTNHANIKPLYKQRFFSTLIPVLLSLIVKSKSPLVRSMLYRAFAHVVIDTPLIAVLAEAKKLVPVLLDCLSSLENDKANKKMIYSILLVISGILLEKNGQEVAVENAPRIVDCLIELTAYSHLVAVRETALQCLIAISLLPHTRVYPMRKKVLRAGREALGDPKQIVRQEAGRCWRAWASLG